MPRPRRDEVPWEPVPVTPWSRRWLQFAVLCLLLAGGFALAPLLGRMPPFDRFVTDPAFFRRCLVAHVDLALVAWFHAFIAALAARLPGSSPRAQGLGLATSASGVALLLGTAAIPGVQPVMSNYIPALDHPLFLAALGLMGAGFAFALLPGLWRGAAATQGAPGSTLEWGAGLPVRAAALAFLVAMMTFGVSATTTPRGMSAQAFHEALFWGGGHVLQVATVAAMLAGWSLLLGPILRRAPVGRRATVLLMGLLCAPLVLAPWLAAQGTTSALYRSGFTKLMQFGIAPVVLVHLALCSWAVATRNRAHAPRLIGLRLSAFATSGVLTLTGFGLGAAIRGSNTLVPAHYHAAIGAVTTTFMAVALAELAPAWQLGAARGTLRLAAWQPALFGGGQVLLAAGFALAGVHGAARKAYGAEQAGRGLAETLGLTVMGLGGLVAVAGGLLFLRLIVPCLVLRPRDDRSSRRASAALAAFSSLESPHVAQATLRLSRSSGLASNRRSSTDFLAPTSRTKH